MNNTVLRIGSQLLINEEDTPQQVRDWVLQMSENGLKVIRLFMVWGQLEPRAGEWTFDKYDACFEQASMSGLTVVPTLMSGSPPGWMRLTNSMQDLADLDDPSYKERAADYIANVVKRYRDHPALDSWVLWNEPTLQPGQGIHGRSSYIRYLRQVFGSIDGYNAIGYKKFDSFEQMEQEENTAAAKGQLPFRSYAEQLGKVRFAVHNLSGQLRWISEQVRRYDALHPLHVNPHNVQRELQSKGQSVWSEAEQADFLGCSAHPMWHSIRFPEQRWGQSIAFFADLMKSATLHPEGLFWVTELQGGTTLFSAHAPYTPSAATIKQWIWEGLGAGAKAVVFWSFNSRSVGYEGGEWALLNQLGEPSPRLLAARKAAELLQRHSELLARTGPEAPRAIVLYSEASCALGEAEGSGTDPANPRNKNMGLDAIAGAWLMCSDLSWPILLRNETRLVQEDIPPSVRLVVLPNTFVLGEAALDRLEEFVRRGGFVIADGLCAMKDAEGRICSRSLASVASRFGAEAEDIEAGGPMPELTMEDKDRFQGWFYRLPLRVNEGASVLARFADGRSAIVRRRSGEGAWIRIGTVLFQAYFARPDADKLRCFERLAMSGAGDPPIGLRLASREDRLRLQRLAHPEGAVIVLHNRGRETEAAVISDSAGRLIDLESGWEAELKEGLPVRLPVVPEEGTAIYFFRIQEQPSPVPDRG